MILRNAILTCFLLGAVTPAGAQPAERQAQALYDLGRASVAAGKTAEGCAAFEQSQQLAPVITTLFALATCRERLGQLATARKLFLRVAAQTRSASDRTAAQLHGLARDRAASLEPRLSKLTIRVPDQRKRGGFEIRRDQESVPAEAWNVELPVDGGTFTITARAPGAKDWSTQVTLALEADAKTVDVPELQEIEPGGAELPKAIAAEQPPGSSGRRSVGLPIAVGAGAVVLLGGAVLFALDQDPVTRPDQVASGRYRETATLGILLGASGAVLAGVGGFLWWRHGEARPAPVIVPASGGAGAVIGLSRSF